MNQGFKNRDFPPTCMYGWKCCNAWNMSPRKIKKLYRKIERKRLKRLIKEELDAI